MDPEQINCGMNLARATVFWKSALVTQNLRFPVKTCHRANDNSYI